MNMFFSVDEAILTHYRNCVHEISGPGIFLKRRCSTGQENPSLNEIWTFIVVFIESLHLTRSWAS